MCLSFPWKLSMVLCFGTRWRISHTHGVVCGMDNCTPLTGILLTHSFWTLLSVLLDGILVWFTFHEVTTYCLGSFSHTLDSKYTPVGFVHGWDINSSAMHSCWDIRHLRRFSHVSYALFIVCSLGQHCVLCCSIMCVCVCVCMHGLLWPSFSLCTPDWAGGKNLFYVSASENCFFIVCMSVLCACLGL